jgi:hypothetical protein
MFRIVIIPGDAIVVEEGEELVLMFHEPFSIAFGDFGAVDPS